MMHLPTALVAAAVLLPLRAAANSTKCLALQHSLHLENTTILNATYIAAPTIVATPGTCQSTAPVTVAPLCRLQFVINTTSTSAVHAEAWLPDTWFGRFLGLGNSGLGGCIDYSNLDYGTSLHFAAVGSDNGHDGNSGAVFLDHPEVINDFASAYYGAPAAKSYYLGCSTGGRQGTQAALKFPGDFDGIVAGSPATDFNHLQLWSGILSHYVEAPTSSAAPSPKFLPSALWAVVSAEILRQCDRLDGVVDGIITEPDACDFRPETIQCTGGNATSCLTPTQVESVKNAFTPLFGVQGQLLYPRYSPGAEADPTQSLILGGAVFPLTLDWGRFAILNDTNATFSNIGVGDAPLWDSINPGGIATFNGDLSAFRNRGGKLLTYHGRRDPVISSTNSKRVYDLISHTLSLPVLDDFYRLFLVPGMGHCSGGLGAPSFGQSNGLNVVNASSHKYTGGIAPETIIGSGANKTSRTHCRYPMRSVFNGTVFFCEV
ncbi:tannase and feruloyl esterase [Mycena capillaripes]|nr:tannase and feruloyl esterase [Mycena capillaripes]